MNNINSYPLIFSIIAVIITYIIIYYDTIYENIKLDKLNKKKCHKIQFTFKAPLIIGLVVWIGITYYIENYNNNGISNEILSSSSLFNLDQEILTDNFFN